jgi:hypothetical protein
MLNLFPQRKFALQHFAATQPLNFRIAGQITTFSSWFTEKVLELPVVEAFGLYKVYNLGNYPYYTLKATKFLAAL